MIKEAMFWEALEGRSGQCHLCAHECRIPDSRFGICGVRQNVGGVLRTMAYGQLVAANTDPIEKKPLYHFLPGSSSFSVATIGCNFKCGFCQNWQISQASYRDVDMDAGRPVMPERIVEEAKRNGCLSISYTYTEPTIFFEYAYDTALLARKAGLRNVFVTNGYMTHRALETIQPYLDAANVDLKSFSEASYKRTCKAHLQPVLDTIAAMKELHIWIEVTTLVVPGENDSDGELRRIADFLAGIDRDIPWHISRFHPDYEFRGRDATPLETLQRAREIGRQAGLRFIYLGNVHEGSHTSCPACRASVVERKIMGLGALHLKDGRCPSCGTAVPGIWS
ncbi:MAG TPA: AmmeMemoRadiSam system radical SAM enzyme [Syntrophales bacterium]|nr:AmmeMemoRadiSam system radical SAM enzyme [Syntrophales bacterium]